MILFFKAKQLFAVEANNQLSKEDIEKLLWLFGDAEIIDTKTGNTIADLTGHTDKIKNVTFSNNNF